VYLGVQNPSTNDVSQVSIIVPNEEDFYRADIYDKETGKWIT